MNQIVSYFGSKYSSAHLYPAPRFGTIIEPFAGSAGYSSHWSSKRVILSDANSVIVDLWKWLIGVDAETIRGLPAPPVGARDWVVPKGLGSEARALLGFWVNPNSSMPKNKMSRFTSGTWSVEKRDEIAEAVAAIRHWRALLASWEAWRDEGWVKAQGVDLSEATLFVDPPYQLMKNYYGAGMKPGAFRALGDFCRGFPGQVIVCEQAAEGKMPDWLDFRPLGLVQTRDGVSRELIWTKENR